MILERKVNIDCNYFIGYIPCKYHKEEGSLCEDCSHYEKVNKKILILKLGAAGEVLRNTPLLRKIKQEYPKSRIFWITDYPELIPQQDVFKTYKFSEKELELVKDIEFDIVYSLDKHEEIGALANQIKSKVKRGFSQRGGSIIPFNNSTVHKWQTGIFDDFMKKNKKHYVEEIFEICGFEFNEEKYLLPNYRIPNVKIDKSKKVIALNVGVGKPWKPRLYSKENWINLSKKLLDKNYEVMIVGGSLEDTLSKEVSKKSGAKYFGTFPYLDFIGLLSLSDAVVTSVTFALHVAIGLEKKIVLLNNTFNKSEFYLYNQGVILEPKVPCLMCYKTDFDDKCHAKNCMNLIKPEEIVEEIDKLVFNKNDK